jgi:hypothetical protein
LRRRLEVRTVLAISIVVKESEGREHTTTSVMRLSILHTHRRGLDVLAFARKLRMLGIIVQHVSCAAATGCVDI